MSQQTQDILLTLIPFALIAVVIVAVIRGMYAWKVGIYRRGVRRDAEHLKALRDGADDALADGRLEEASRLAAEAVGFATRERLPAGDTASAHFLLGLISARQGNDHESLANFQTARALVRPFQDGRLATLVVLIDANMSFVLRRLGRLDEALAAASDGASRKAEPSRLAPFEAAGPAFAKLALALVLTDKGLDGREAARSGLATFRELDEQGHLSDTEGIAYACYVTGYAMRARGEDFEPLAREAVERFASLHERAPNLYATRLADAKALTA